jgi:hypothetical protein
MPTTARKELDSLPKLELKIPIVMIRFEFAISFSKPGPHMTALDADVCVNVFLRCVSFSGYFTIYTLSKS